MSVYASTTASASASAYLRSFVEDATAGLAAAPGLCELSCQRPSARPGAIHRGTYVRAWPEPLPVYKKGKRMLKFAQLRSKAEIFAEITRNYPWVGDMRGGWEIEKFDFTPPSDRWMDAFKPLATFELELKSIPESGKFDVWISGTTPKGDVKRATVGTIAKQVEIRRCLS